MATYTRPISAQLLASGLVGTLGYRVRALDGSSLIGSTTAGIVEDGTSAIYSASVPGWDPAWSGRIVWSAGGDPLASEDFLPYDPSPGGSTVVTLAPGAIKAATLATGADTPFIKLDLSQDLAQSRAATVGGALQGAWTTAWGKVIRDRVNRLLKLYGSGSQLNPLATFSLDNADAPTSKVLQG